MEKSRVSIVKLKDKNDKEEIFKAVERALGYLGDIKTLFKPTDKVMIKPNYTGNLTPESGAVTSPEVLEAIIVVLKNAGICDIIIGEGCGTVHIGTDKIYQYTGVKKIAQKYDVKLLDLNKDKMRVVRAPGFSELDKVRIAETVFNVDKIINVPVLKTHSLTKITVALKNMKGVIAPPEKRKFHNLNLHKAVADLNYVLPKYITIVDGLICQEGLGPAEGTPVNLGIIMAGNNSVAVDTIAAKIMGFEPKEIAHLKYSAQKGLGSYNLGDIEILGEKIANVIHPFKPAVAKLKQYKNVEIIAKNACSGCIAAIIIALDRMEKMGDLPKFGDFNILLGTGPFELDKTKNCFLVGHCTRGFYAKHKDDSNVYHIQGCAPAGLEVEERIREKYGIPRDNTNFL